MAESEVEKKLEALRDRPTVTGKVVAESADSVVLRVGGVLVEAPTRSVAARADAGAAAGGAGKATLTLNPDAEVLVSSVVPVGGGLVGGNVFAAAGPAVLRADACNCNCNCEHGNCNCNCNCNERAAAAAFSALPAAEITRFTNCQCPDNCNCNCNESSRDAAIMVPAAAITFRRPFVGGMMGTFA